jgi:CheY-like chemotaxis protein
LADDTPSDTPAEIERLLARAEAALAGLRVLVVEDEFLIALDLGSILDALGCVVLGPAATVAEALRLLAADPPDAALLDLNLNGTRTTPVALALAAGGVPFATVSAYTSRPEPVFDGVPAVAKPFAPERVRDALLGLARP